MARNYGRIATSIWRDHDFRDVSPLAKLVYLTLISQADISPCGVLAVTRARWTQSTGLSVRELADALAELERRRYVVVDNDTEEVLVRSFVRWDGGAGNELRRKAIKDSANSVESGRIAHALALELDRAKIPHDLPSPYQSPIEAASEPVGSPVDTHRVVVTEGEYVPQPLTTTRNPRAEPVPGGHDPPTAQLLVAEWIDRCAKRPPKDTIARIGKHVAAMLAEPIDPDDIRRGLASWMTKGLDPATLPSVVNEVMNSPPSKRGSTADNRVRDALELAEQLERKALG